MSNQKIYSKDLQKARIKQKNGIPLTEYDKSVLKVGNGVVAKKRNHKRPKHTTKKKSNQKKKSNKWYKKKQRAGHKYSKMLKKQITKHEKMLMDALNNEHVIFSFQCPIVSKDAFYIPDFYFVLRDGTRLVVEVDGKQHLHGRQREKDKKRDLWFRKKGRVVLRFQNNRIEFDLDGVLDEILSYNPRCWDNENI